MARSPRSKPKPQSTPASQLLSALKFVSVASHAVGTPNQTHVILANKRALAFDGLIAACAPIEEDINATPRTSLLIEALSKCGQNLSITQLDGYNIAVKSEKFRAIVPCLNDDLLSIALPDPPMAAINDDLKWALQTVSSLASETGEHVVTASILMLSRSVIATNRTLLFEAWHGIDLPPGIVLPKAAVTALVKSADKLTQFGFSQSSVTFYFENGSWLRAQLYNNQWPNFNSVLDAPCNPKPIPKDFFPAVNAISAFAFDSYLYFQENLLCAHTNSDRAGATYEVLGLPRGPAFNAKFLKMLEPYATSADFFVDGKMLFFGDKIRGVLCGRTIEGE